MAKDRSAQQWAVAAFAVHRRVGLALPYHDPALLGKDTMRGRTLTIWSILASLLAVAPGCAKPSSNYFSGYAEADYVRLASPIAGTLAWLHVERGDRVEKDALLFVLEQGSERAAHQEAAARVERAEANVLDLKKGMRPDEVAAIEAQLAQARAALQLSSANQSRQRMLAAARFISPATLDESRSAVERDRGLVNELLARLRVAKLGARTDQIAAAGQELKTAQAQLAQADWRLAQKTQRAPVSAEVTDVLYREGEWVQAGSPVVTLLPPGNIKARFFVPETAVGRLRIGQDVELRCDGCARPLPARITYLSRAPEYTFPQIYSRENRSAMVFMVEARPAVDDARLLHPGQPLEVAVPGVGPQGEK
jgi:HlyD family secretion protein